MSLFMGLSPQASGTRILVTDRDEVRVKARLSCPPSHPRAMKWLIEAVALWEGAPVRAVLCAGGARRTYADNFRADWLSDFGGPLYSLEIDDGARTSLRDRLNGLGGFRDLKQLRLSDAVRVRDRQERR